MDTGLWMRRIILIGLVAWAGCGPEEGKVEVLEKAPDIAVLKDRFVDKKKGQGERLEAGRLLLEMPRGKQFVADQYWKSHRKIVQALLDTLTQSRPKQAGQLLAALMQKAGGEAKVHFESQLIALGPAAVDALIELAEEKTDWQTTMQTLDALGKLKAVEGVDVMRAHLSHEKDWVRIAAAHALGDVGGPEAVAALVKATSDSSETVVAAAVTGLGKTGDKRALKTCRLLLTHKNPRVRGAAVSAIGRLGGVEDRGLLEPMLKDRDSGVQYKTRQALEMLK